MQERKGTQFDASYLVNQGRVRGRILRLESRNGVDVTGVTNDNGVFLELI